MIAALAASMGLSATDSAFWMPLLLMTLLLSLLLGAILFDGFDIGVGLLLPSAPLAPVVGGMAPGRPPAGYMARPNYGAMVRMR